MQRPEYNQTVRETLKQLEITIDDCINIYQNKDNFTFIMSQACYEKFDDSYQPVVQAVNMLEMLYNIIKKCNPDVVLLFQLLNIWQEALLSEKVQISQQFSKLLYSNNIKLTNNIQAQIQNFISHVQKHATLISAVLDFTAPQEDIDIQPIYIPAHSYKDLSEARLVNPEEEQVKKEQEKTIKIDPQISLKEELKLMTYEDKFGKRMQVDIIKKNQRLRHLKALQQEETRLMGIEEEFSNKLTEIYRQELHQREEEQKVRQLVTETVNPSLNSCFHEVTTALRGDSKKK